MAAFYGACNARGPVSPNELTAAPRIVERERWATIVPADPKEKPIEMASDGAGKWLFGQ